MSPAESKRRLRIVLVTSFPRDPARPVGGVESVCVTLTRALSAQEDLELHVVTMDATCAERERSDWGRAVVHRLPRRGRWTLTHAVRGGRRQISEYLATLTPDVVHAHDTYGLMVKGLPLPRVFTIHGFIHGDTLISGERFAWLRSKIWRRVETNGWAEQPRIISISPYVRERLTGIATGMIHDIDNPVPEAFFQVSRAERPGKILSTGLICPRKNTLGLIDALALLRKKGVDAELCLAGAVSSESYGQRVRERISALGLWNRAYLLGSIESERIRSELSTASVFALVSLEEGSPMSIEEAMAAGVPVVTSNRCGMPYMVRDGETGYLVDPTDPKDIAWRLGQLLVNAPLRSAMGAKAREIARDRFHPAAVARRTREVYLRALHDHAGRDGRVSP